MYNPTVYSVELAIFILEDLEWPKPVQHSLFYDWLRYFFQQFRLGGPVKAGEEEEDFVSD